MKIIILPLLPLIMKIWKAAFPMKLRQPMEIVAVVAVVAVAGVLLLSHLLVFQIFKMKSGGRIFYLMG
jgi:hypothetical protein